jgi:hypothetical protein
MCSCGPCLLRRCTQASTIQQRGDSISTATTTTITTTYHRYHTTLLLCPPYSFGLSSSPSFHIPILSLPTSPTRPKSTLPFTTRQSFFLPFTSPSISKSARVVARLYPLHRSRSPANSQLQLLHRALPVHIEHPISFDHPEKKKKTTLAVLHPIAKLSGALSLRRSLIPVWLLFSTARTS